jgi:hypothetical protein
MLSHILTLREAKLTQRAIDALRGVQWAEPLLARLDKNGGVIQANKPLLFEVRFAFELHVAGLTADYEFSAGVGDSTVDFFVPGPVNWLIEIVSVGVSQAVQRATRKAGLIYVQHLSSDSVDCAQSEEAEMITAEQKIGEKVMSNGVPVKFPTPGVARHLILTDTRGYLDDGGDIWDYRQMAYGAAGIPVDRAELIHYWRGPSGRAEPIKGLFEQGNPLKAAALIQQRIHFLGFVCEHSFEEGEIRNGYYCANWHLFPTDADAKDAWASFPLPPISTG